MAVVKKEADGATEGMCETNRVTAIVVDDLATATRGHSRRQRQSTGRWLSWCNTGRETRIVAMDDITSSTEWQSVRSLSAMHKQL